MKSALCLVNLSPGVNKPNLSCEQWGSEIQLFEFRTCLNFEWLKRGWFANGPDFE